MKTLYQMADAPVWRKRLLAKGYQASGYLQASFNLHTFSKHYMQYNPPSSFFNAGKEISVKLKLP